MPLLGFGVYMMTDPKECETSVLQALETGYRLLDTSSAYFNEEAVGRAIKESGIPREELFVTTKLWIQDAGYENAKAGFETSLQKLGLDYLDLYLIHQPCGDCYGSWRSMTELYQEGRIRAIGVCNFGSDRLVDFIMNNELPPAVNQVEFHPYYQQKAAEKIMREYDVQMEAWSPLGHGGKGILENETLISIGKKYGKTPAQVILRWDVERGIPDRCQDLPWQTCTCIGGWHYNTSIYEGGGYKSAATVVRQLVDIVSKNGNLLLNIPLRADGTYDEKEAAVLDDLEAWMTQNGESIFGTRPWAIFGEGPVAEKTIKMNAQGFNDGQYAGVGSRDIRFNQTKKHLYATALAWPEDGRLVVRSLRKGNPYMRRTIGSVWLLGYGKLRARQTDQGLEVTLPAQPCNKIAPVLRINK